MDGFTGFKSAAGEELPQARTVMPELHRLGWFVFQSGVFRWDSGGGVVVSGH